LPLVKIFHLPKLSLEPVVWRFVGWDCSPDVERCPDSAGEHFTELNERPFPEATPATAGRRHKFPVDVSPDVL